MVVHMIKMDKHIEIVSSTEPGLSSMGIVSRAGAKVALARHFKSVDITIVNNMSDLQALARRKPDLVFLGMAFLPVNPALGRQDPEKIWLSEYLESQGIAYTGSDKFASMLERNKHLAKKRVLAWGLETSPFLVAEQGVKLRKDDIDLVYPLFVKPANQGGGVGVDSASVVHTFEQLQSKVHAIATKFRSDSLIEQYLPGREFSVAILRQEDSTQFWKMPLELIAPPDQNGARILSGEIKSLDTEAFVEVRDKDTRSIITNLALDVFQALGACDYGRIDIRMDAAGKAYFLEANLIPSLMDGYGNFPKACWLNIGMEYEAMLVRIANLGLARNNDIERILEPIMVTDTISGPAIVAPEPV
jgi:D-alanine-D-alanine ligase